MFNAALENRPLHYDTGFSVGVERDNEKYAKINEKKSTWCGGERMENMLWPTGFFFEDDQYGTQNGVQHNSCLQICFICLAPSDLGQ